VKIGIHLPTQQKVAIKILEKSKIINEKDKERINREIKILKTLRHQNIIQLYDSITSDKHIYLIMEYVDGGDLYNYINDEKYLDENKTCVILTQLFSAVEYIQTLGIVHRDIKPENILLDENFSVVKLVDFGLSNTFKAGEYVKTACGSPCYAAPEMISGSSYNGLASDIWSCGVVLYCMLCGRLPFDENNIKELYRKITFGEYVIPSRLSAEAKDLLTKILEVDPDKRITLNQIKKHPWMLKFSLKRNLNNIQNTKDDIKIDTDIINEISSLPFYSNNKNDNLKQENIIQAIINNVHNSITTTYYILCKMKNKLIKEQNHKKLYTDSQPKKIDTNNLLHKNQSKIVNGKSFDNKQIKLKEEIENSKNIQTFENVSITQDLSKNVVRKNSELLVNKEQNTILNNESFSKNIIIQNNQNPNFNVLVINNILPDSKSLKINNQNENLICQKKCEEANKILNKCLNMNLYMKKEEQYPENKTRNIKIEHVKLKSNEGLNYAKPSIYLDKTKITTKIKNANYKVNKDSLNNILSRLNKTKKDQTLSKLNVEETLDSKVFDKSLNVPENNYDKLITHKKKSTKLNELRKKILLSNTNDFDTKINNYDKSSKSVKDKDGKTNNENKSNFRMDLSNKNFNLNKNLENKQLNFSDFLKISKNLEKTQINKFQDFISNANVSRNKKISSVPNHKTQITKSNFSYFSNISNELEKSSFLKNNLYKTKNHNYQITENFITYQNNNGIAKPTFNKNVLSSHKESTNFAIDKKINSLNKKLINKKLFHFIKSKEKLNSTTNKTLLDTIILKESKSLNASNKVHNKNLVSSTLIYNKKN